MYIETKIKVNFTTELGDSWVDKKLSKKEVREIAENHIADYCQEHDLDIGDVKIIKIDITK